MVLSIPPTVTPTFGATYHFTPFLTPSPVTKLLAQFAAEILATKALRGERFLLFSTFVFVKNLTD
jgi:hypothetical protein